MSERLTSRMLEEIWQAVDGDEAKAERLAQEHVAAIACAEASAERIRATAARPACSCTTPAAAVDGRCGRCHGWPS